jgi:hypothetical protein
MNWPIALVAIAAIFSVFGLAGKWIDMCNPVCPDCADCANCPDPIYITDIYLIPVDIALAAAAEVDNAELPL